MKYRKLHPLILAIPVFLLLSSCFSGSQALLDEKDKELTQLRSELKDLEGRLDAQEKALAESRKERDAAAEKFRIADQKSTNYLAELETLREAKKQEFVLGNRIVLTNALVFSPGSAQISSRGKQVLDEILETVRKYPNREIIIEGHTDNVPIAKGYRWKYASNWELSAARALSVLHYFESAQGVPTNLLRAMALGEQKPMASNRSDEGRGQNRRVEIIIGAPQK
jgi:chemotaxis protein MotB